MIMLIDKNIELTWFPSAIGKVNETVFVDELPPPWVGHDMEVDLRSCVLWFWFVKFSAWVIELDWCDIDLLYCPVLTLFDELMDNGWKLLLVGIYKFSTEPCGVSSSPSSSKTTFWLLSVTVPKAFSCNLIIYS